MDVDGAMGIHLQEEMIIYILSRLPVRSLLRFKCVSEFWMTLISKPYFTMKHLHHAKISQNTQKILVSKRNCFSGQFSLCCSSLSSVQVLEDIEKLDWPSNFKPWSCRVYCCYDSFALIGIGNYPECKDLLLLLWNPYTRESIVLPHKKLSLERQCTCGLGYDSASDDYKILKIDHTMFKGEILALKSGSWGKIDRHPTAIYPRLSCMDSLIFVHGAFHWIDYSLKNSVVSFRISNEMYGEVPLPEGLYLFFNTANIQHGVSVFGGMLCAYSTCAYQSEDTFKLWVMKDYDVKESWNQLFTIQGTEFPPAMPRYRFSDEELLLCCIHMRHTGPQSVAIQQGFVYTESLISPKLLT